MNNIKRIMTCGNVDDGKSTLIGNMFYQINGISIDQREGLGEDIDYSQLFDGLEDELTQGITIDVAYKYLSYNEMNYIFADSPGHEEFTRNMVVAASNSNIAIIICDATKEIKKQTIRHIEICKLFGIEKMVFSVNKMDKVNFDQEVFDNIKDTIKSLLSEKDEAIFIPTVATKGINVVHNSNEVMWYKGKSVWEAINTFGSEKQATRETIISIQHPFQLSDSRYFRGELISGKVKKNDVLTVYPSKLNVKIKDIYCGFDQLTEVDSDKQITFTVFEDVSISRGDVLSSKEERTVNNKYETKIVWFVNQNYSNNNEYIIKINSKEINAKLDVETTELYKNNIIDATVYFNEDIPYFNYKENKDLATFIVIDKVSFQTVGCGIIKNSERAKKLYSYEKAFTIWLTGLSGSGKTTLAYKLKESLKNLSHKIIILDGDELRYGLNSDLSFSLEDREENNRRIAEIAKLLNMKGYIVVCSTISPTESIRKTAKNIIEKNKYFEVYLDIEIEECIMRDPKGLYSRNISKFTGLDSPFEVPSNPNLILDTFNSYENECVLKILDKLIEEDYLKEADF